MSEVPCICGCNSVSICVCFCDQILVASVFFAFQFCILCSFTKIEMITAKESKQAAKGRMQMYQPAQRLARGNAGEETKNQQIIIIVVVVVMESADRPR